MEKTEYRPAAIFKEGKVESEGLRLRYLEAGQGESVVMVDGITSGVTRLHDALAQNYHVVAIELPYFERSQSSNKPLTARDIAHIVAQAIAELAPGKYTLIGTSIGADVALWQTLHDPSNVETLILISPTAILPRVGVMAYTPEEAGKLIFASPEKRQGLSAEYPEVVVREQALMEWLKGAGHDAEAESRLSEIQCQTLVVFGSKDNAVSPEAARVYRENIPNSNISFVYDAGHMIVVERPDALINVVADYIERRDAFVVNRRSTLINP